MDNIGPRDLAELRGATRAYLSLTSAEVDEAIEEKRLKEVDCDGQEVP